MNRMLVFIIFLIVLSTIQGFAQEQLLFAEVVHVDSASKKTLFASARSWLSDAFRDYKEVSQIQDAETGELTVKGIVFTHYNKNSFGDDLRDYPCYVRFKITIWVKDGRYKYEFSNYDDSCFGLLTTKESIKESGLGKNTINARWKEAKQGAVSATESLINSLKSAMSKSTEIEDW